MLVSWTWLSRYLDLSMSHEALADALSLSGLNHEETLNKAGEIVIDLEVTSNRSDCLSHIGVAREISVLYDKTLQLPNPLPQTIDRAAKDVAKVRIDYPEACSRYTARLIKGCKIKSSPAWLANSLNAIGIGVVNNIVDITNYVMMECGQPLHAFDLAKLAGSEICVRRANAGETLAAIDHKSYALDPSMCVIADANSAVAVAGVMGGASTEVSTSTSDLLIEAALFSPMSVRQTARALKLHSPSSFRFERRVDPAGVDWASRRACELILELAGGELLQGVLDAGTLPDTKPPVVMRLSQIERILGIQVDREIVVRILTALGCNVLQPQSDPLTIIAPSWRHDLSREADMIEEIARIHGYDKIPEDSPISVVPSARRDWDHAMDKVRVVMSAAGISEAMTPSVVTESLDAAMSPWTQQTALETITPLLKGANRLRRSLLPSLLQSRADNWTAATLEANLYEIAHVYLPGTGLHELPREQTNLGIVSGQDYLGIKGLIETLVRRMGCTVALTVQPLTSPGFDPLRSASITLGEHHLGYLGQIEKSLAQRWKLPAQTCVAELALDVLLQHSILVPQFHSISPYPSIERDLNLVVAESIRWMDIECSTRAAVGHELASVQYRETYRAPDKDGANTKRLLFSVQLRRDTATLTGEEADAMIASIIDRCTKEHGAKLLA